MLRKDKLSSEDLVINSLEFYRPEFCCKERALSIRLRRCEGFQTSRHNQQYFLIGYQNYWQELGVSIHILYFCQQNSNIFELFWN